VSKAIPDDDPAVTEMEAIIREEEASRAEKTAAHKALIERIREIVRRSKAAKEDAALGPPGQDE
jgi:hypothetical protein